MVIAVTRLIPGRCDRLQFLVLTFTSDDDFRRLCSVKFQVVDLCPFFYVVNFGNTRLSVTGWYKDVGVVCVLMYPVTRGDSIQVASINNIRDWPKGGPC